MADLNIHWHDMADLDASAREAIERRLESLAEGHSDLIDIRITGRKTRHHQHGAQEARIVCEARGREIVAARTRPDLGLALDEALDTFEREVRRLRDKRRDRSRKRPAEPSLLGIVDRVFRDEAYGFVLTDGGDEVYFHRNAVQEGLDFDRLQEADRVALEIEPGREGLQATAVFAPPPA